MSKSNVRELARSGRYGDALRMLNNSSSYGDSSTKILKAELLERTGQLEECHRLIEQLPQKQLTKAEQSACEYILALMAWQLGNAEESIRGMQRATFLAQSGKDLMRLCWSQLRLTTMLSESRGSQVVSQLLSELRVNVARAGDPILTAALHILVGQTDAKRGLVQTALRHVRCGLRLLETDENVWLVSVAENTNTAIGIMTADMALAASSAKRGIKAAEESGSPWVIKPLLGNLGVLNYRLGHFELALEFTNRGMEILPESNEQISALEMSARILIAQGRIDEARSCVREVQKRILTEADWTLYPARHAQLLVAEMLSLEGRLAEAHEAVEFANALAEQLGDHVLLTSGLIAKANVLQRQARHVEAAAVLALVAKHLPHGSPELMGDYERAWIGVLKADRDRAGARMHYERANRLYQALQHAPGLLELNRAWNSDEDGAVDERMPASPHLCATNTLQTVVEVLMNCRRPEVIASLMAALAIDTGCATTGFAVTRNGDGFLDHPQSVDGTSPASEDVHQPLRHSSTSRRTSLPIGRTGSGDVELTLELRNDAVSIATFNALTLLLHITRDLEHSYKDREERLALWPIDEIPVEDDNAVINGRMREVMTLARRVAPTSASVLITGESGTGKEIVARAIHGYSTRAQRPFIPFNCTAIPREMLESQLFGHRRGAFTSADRDNPGLIRAARDGTLFLDEIGELGIDLQPKLLRFLESGEICPLGESTPINVDVRIVAATNRNLEELVREGRFREDLFYRLNVIRVTVPPLRERRDEIPPLVYHFVTAAAGEFKKGRIRVADETMEHLLLYPWPGNVRQLHNEIRRMVALADADSILKPADLSQDLRRATAKSATRATGQIAVSLDDKLTPTISRIEREMIRSALKTHQGQLEAAARALGISRKGLYLKRQRLGL